MGPDAQDLAVIQRIEAGNSNAYRGLVIRYQDRVFRLCVSFLRNSAEAEDAAQEVFLKAFLSLKNFRKDSSFFTWLYRIGCNHCLSVIRSRKRRPSESWDELLEKEGEKLYENLQTAPDTGRALTAGDLVEKLLAGLKPEYREVLVLRESEGLSYEEIAEILDCTLDAVKARLKRARQEIEEKGRHFLKAESVQE